MKNSVYEFSHYKAYLEHRARLSSKRGFKSQLSQAAGVQSAYLSQVFHGKAHLSLEQAQAAGDFLEHTEDENGFFLLLVQKDKAGTPRLRKHFEKQIASVLKDRLHVSKRLAQETTLTPADQAVYYGSWLYAAVHMAVSLPDIGGRDEIARSLRVSPERVAPVLEFLLDKGLIVREGDRFRVGPSRVFLGKSSEHILRHHTNWRNQAIDSLDRETDRDLHYSSIFTLSATDVLRLKDRLLETIQGNVKIIQDSPEEELYVLNMDLFSLKK